MKSRTLIILTVALLGLLLAGCQQVSNLIGGAQPTAAPVVMGQSSADVVVEGRIVPKDNAELFFTASGEVEEILVAEGDTVSQGQVLARLGDRESYEASLAAAKFELITAQQAYDDLNEKAALASDQDEADVVAAERGGTDAQARYDEYDTDDYQQKIDDADVKVNDAETEVEDAQDDFDRYKDLDEDNTDRKNAEDKLQEAEDKYDLAVRERDVLVNDRAQARADLALAEARLEDVRATRDARASGPDPDDVALAQARLDNAQAQVDSAQAALDNLSLAAPFAGVIVRLDISLGARAVPTKVVMVIADFSAWYVETNDLTEHEVVRIDPSATVSIEPDALPDLLLSGTIESISDLYTEKSGDITYKTKILLDDDIDGRLRWGMTVQIRFPEK